METTQKEVSGLVQYCSMHMHSNVLGVLGLSFRMVPVSSKNKIF